MSIITKMHFIVNVHVHNYYLIFPLSMNSVLGNLFSACIQFIHFTDLHCLDVDLL